MGHRRVERFICEQCIQQWKLFLFTVLHDIFR
jgi:hypothetical protein